MSNRLIMQHKSELFVVRQHKYYGKPLDVNQRIFGVPGASISGAADMDEERVALGLVGERRVGEVLERIAARHPNMYVFHSVKLLNAKGDIDHIVVQGNQVLLVDAKNWQSGHEQAVEYRLNGYAGLVVDFVTRDGVTFPGGKISFKKQLKAWHETLDAVGHSNHWAIGGTLVAVANNINVGYDQSFVTAATAGSLGDANWYEFVSIATLEESIERVFEATNDSPPLDYDALRLFADLVQDETFGEATEYEKIHKDIYQPYFDQDQMDLINTPVTSTLPMGLLCLAVFIVGLFFQAAAVAALLSAAGLVAAGWYLFKTRPKQFVKKKIGFFMVWVSLAGLLLLTNLLGLLL